jgi:hypothetical protein
MIVDINKEFAIRRLFIHILFKIQLLNLINNQCVIYLKNNPSRENRENLVNGDSSFLLENRCR